MQNILVLTDISSADRYGQFCNAEFESRGERIVQGEKSAIGTVDVVPEMNHAYGIQYFCVFTDQNLSW